MRKYILPICCFILYILNLICCDRTYLINQLETFDLEDLKIIALKAESLIKDNNSNIKYLDSISNYTNQLQKNSFKNYIINAVNSYKFLADNNNLLLSSSDIIYNKEFEILNILNSNNINKFNLKTACISIYYYLKITNDNYLDEFESLQFIKNVEFMTHESLKEYITSKLYNKRDYNINLQMLNLIYKSNYNMYKSTYEFEKYLNSLTKEELVSYVIPLEKYYNNIYFKNVETSLEQYITKLSKDNIINYIKILSFNVPVVYIKDFINSLKNNNYKSTLSKTIKSKFISFVTNLAIEEIKYIFLTNKMYFNFNYSWLKINEIDENNTSYYRDAILSLIISNKLFTDINTYFEKSINFPIGGYNKFVDGLTSEDIDKYLDIISVKLKEKKDISDDITKLSNLYDKKNYILKLSKEYYEIIGLNYSK